MSDTGTTGSQLDLTGSYAEWLASSDFAGLLAAPQEDRPIPRPVRDPATGRFVTSDEPGLVGRDGYILRDADGNVADYYDPQKAALEFYYGSTPEQRQLVLDTLAAKGIRTDSYAYAINALTEVHQTANTFGKSFSVMMDDITLNVPNKPADAPARVAPIRITSTQDLKKVVQTTARSVLGQEIDDAIATSIAQQFQQKETAYGQQARVQSGGTIEGVSDPTVFSEEKLREMFSSEAAGYDFLGYADQFFGALRGRF